MNSEKNANELDNEYQGAETGVQEEVGCLVLVRLPN